MEINPNITLTDVAKNLNLTVDRVRDILTEKTDIKVTKDDMDKVFQVARKMGYDFKKLKLGKRMNLRKEAIESILSTIEANPKWKRKEIVAYLKKSCEMVERVHKRTFTEEFC